MIDLLLRLNLGRRELSSAEKRNSRAYPFVIGIDHIGGKSLATLLTHLRFVGYLQRRLVAYKNERLGQTFFCLYAGGETFFGAGS